MGSNNIFSTNVGVTGVNVNASYTTLTNNFTFV